MGGMDLIKLSDKKNDGNKIFQSQTILKHTHPTKGKATEIPGENPLKSQR